MTAQVHRRAFLAGSAALLAAPYALAMAQTVPNSAGTDLPRLRAPAGACDSHIHIFDPARFPTVEGSQSPPHTAVADYRLMQKRLGTSRTVVVTPRPYGTDNRVTVDAVAQLGRQNARGIAVVKPEISDRELKELADGGICGIRFTVHNPAASVVQVDMIEPLARRIADLGWHLQLHLRADQIAASADMLKRLPATLVFDHMGRLPQPAGVKHPAFNIICELIDGGRCWLKLSGPYQDSKAGAPDYADVTEVARAFVQRAPERLVWGSDWPHTTEKEKPNGASLLDLLSKWCRDEQDVRRVLVDNPRALYGFQ